VPDPTATERTSRAAPPSGRTYTQWTTDDLEAAEALVAGGSLQRAADLCWALLGDSRVKAAAETRVKGLLRLPLAWEEAGDRRSSGRVARALEGGDWYLAHSEAALCSLAMWGILLGIGLAQRVWELRDGRWLGVLKPYDARFLRWNAQRRVWTVRTAAGEEDIIPGGRRWVLYAPSCSGLPDGDERPWMYGAWRACGRPWLLKYDALGDFGHHSQMHGSAIRTADYDPAKAGDAKGTAAKPVRDDLNNTLADIGADTAIVPPPGYTVRLVEATAKTWEMFPAQTDLAAREIVIAITGQSSSTEIAEGQDTGATLHGIVRQDLIEADAQTLSTCLHDQALEDYAEVNFGSRELACWPRWKTEAPVNAKARGDAMKSLGDGIAALDTVAPEGKRVNRLAVFEQAGIPLEDTPAPEPLTPATLPSAVAALREDGWPLALTDGRVSAELDGEYFDVPLAAAGVTNFPAEGDDKAVSLRNSGFDRVPLAYALSLRDDHPDVWAKGGNVLGNRQFSRLLPVVRRGGKPETATEELAVRLREAWCARHSKAGTGATIAGAVAAVKWWTFLNRPEQLRRVIADATSKDTP
jgi:hypothetical protein